MLHRSLHPPNERGQGLVEYALIVVLVAVVVITILVVLGPGTRNVFCQITAGLGADVSNVCDVVTISHSTYDSGNNTALLKATYNGGYDPAVTLTASPGGAMSQEGNHYRLDFTLTGCPCTVTVTASTGASARMKVTP